MPYRLTKIELDKIHEHIKWIPFDYIEFDGDTFMIMDDNHWTTFDFSNIDNIKMIDYGDV